MLKVSSFRVLQTNSSYLDKNEKYKYEYECDQFRVSISSVRYTKYFIINSTEILSLPWKPSKTYDSPKTYKVQNFLDQTIFERGCCQENYTFFKIFIWDAKFSHLLQNLELALKFQMSHKKANNLSD